MPKFAITKLSEAQMRGMAIDWVANKIFSERHVVPYKREVILAVFPSLAEACTDLSTANEIQSYCGMVCALLVDRLPGKMLRTTDENGQTHTYPIFRTCMFVHKDQLQALQRMIEEERKRKKKWKKPPPMMRN